MREFLVVAGWLKPEMKIGICEIESARGRETISFRYDEEWLKKHPNLVIDPDIISMEVRQYPPEGKQCFGFLSDTAPDRWGRMLMKRRESADAADEKRPVRTLMESDYILGVHDAGRIGGLRFMSTNDNNYYSDRDTLAAPPMEKLRELESAVSKLELGEGDMRKWLKNLLDPGSSLGGARPKANVLDEQGAIWIAKFPSRHDEIDVGAWEMVAHNLSLRCGIKVPEAKAMKLSKTGTTFLTRRFDRDEKMRVHYASAMTMLGKNDGEQAGYIDIADAIEQIGCKPVEDLKELWKRMVFNICISNTDDHLRNHGFLLSVKGWRLSPAFDINPNIEKTHMDLVIGDSNNKSIKEAQDIADFFRIDKKESLDIIGRIQKMIREFWKYEADSNGIPTKEQNIMKDAFEKAYSSI